MALISYPVLCYRPGCPHEAHFKIAARWSDGVTSELKTYYLACPRCLAILFQSAQRKRAKCRLAAGETLEPPGIFQLTRGTRDQELVRRDDLELETENNSATGYQLPSNQLGSDV